jgi:nucleotide-binding universal stress UspA family protein
MHTAHSRLTAIQEEMREMGEMILFMAQETAIAANVTAYPEVREGEVEAQIIALCGEVDADVVVVGEPLPGRTTAAFTGEKLAGLRARLKEQCRAELVLVP